MVDALPLRRWLEVPEKARVTGIVICSTVSFDSPLAAELTVGKEYTKRRVEPRQGQASKQGLNYVRDDTCAVFLPDQSPDPVSPAGLSISYSVWISRLARRGPLDPIRQKRAWGRAVH